MDSQGRVVIEPFFMLVACVLDSVESMVIIEPIDSTAESDWNETRVALIANGNASDSRSPEIMTNLLKRK